MTDEATTLDDLDEEYDQVEPQERGSYTSTMPDGSQQAILVDLGITTRESDGHRQLTLKFQNRLGSVRDWRDLDADNGIGLRIAKGDLTMLGFEDKLSALPAWIAEGAWRNMVCQINKRTRPGDTRDFTDVFLNGVAGVAADPGLFAIDQAAAAQAAADRGDFVQGGQVDDDIPF